MKKLLSAGAALALLAAVPANANDHRPAMMDVAQSWTGFYVSGSLGAGAVVHEVSSPFLPGVSFNGIGGEGMLASVGIGYNRDLRPGWVGGVFLDADVANISTDLEIAGFGTFSIEQSRTLYAGARLGYLTSPSTLWYGMVGWSQAKFNIDSPIPLPISSASFNGLFLGGGVESQLGRGWGVKAEYRYADYGAKTFFGAVTLEPSTHTARIGLTYSFNRNEAPAAHPMK